MHILHYLGLALFQVEGAAEALEGNPEVLHYFGAAVGLGLVVIGAAIGIGKFTAAAVEGIARQPSATSQITGAFLLPMFLLEGVAIIAAVLCGLVILIR